MVKSGTINSRPYSRYLSTRQEIVGGTDDRSLQEVADRFSVYLRGWMPPDYSASILDAGCGNGNALYAFSTWGYSKLEGVDLSEEQVQEAQKRFPQVKCEDIFTYLSDRDEMYDLITAFDLIEHFSPEEAMKFIDYANHALCNGGSIIIQTPNAAGLRPGNLMWGDFTHKQNYAPPALRQMLYLSGFSDVEFRETIPVIHGLKSLLRAGLWRCVRAGAAACDMIETGKKQDVYTRNMMVFARKAKKVDSTYERKH